jgi:hypothetical protein
MMNKSGPRAINYKEFMHSSYKQFGMQVVVFAAFVNDEGDPLMTLWV